ncbi:hypothetical protein SO802_000826 [Lithocarpus litseifolius]|uniref:Uncharacterized protein n=1 Tax=Lithocarpus litseifolius TaxID=425828 RepID=A0AAW2DVA8_9ROSI
MAYASIKHWAAVGLTVLVELSAEKSCAYSLLSHEQNSNSHANGKLVSLVEEA